MAIFVWKILCVVVGMVGILCGLTSTSSTQHYEVPLNVPTLRVRKDAYLGKPVEHDRISLIADLRQLPKHYDSNKKQTLREFQRVLQCAPYQAALHDKCNSLLTPSSDIVELVVAFVETERGSWNECRNNELPRFKRGDILHGGKLMRIINGTLYIDWPWGRSRFDHVDRSHNNLIFFVLSMVSDLPDSVFLLGEETHVLPWLIPFPSFASSPSIENADMPFPWPRSFISELSLHRRYFL